jgi:hypothetical protein
LEKEAKEIIGGTLIKCLISSLFDVVQTLHGLAQLKYMQEAKKSLTQKTENRGNYVLSRRFGRHSFKGK